MIGGALTALITPFTDDNELDINSFDKLVEWQISQKINGLVVVGTTGESATLSHDEHKFLIEYCVRTTKGRVPVVAGAGSNSTKEAIELAKHAQAAKVDALLVVTPYYNKPCQRGLIEHYSAIASAVTIPIIIYNIPGRSVIDILPQTIKELTLKHKNIVGVKDATGRIERVAQQRSVCGSNFIQLSGNDCTAIAFNAQGGQGCISVTSNVAPKLCAELQAACKNEDYKTAITINDKLQALNEALFLEPNPAGVKYAVSRLGLCSEHVRSPMVSLEEKTKKIIDEAMDIAGLL